MNKQSYKFVHSRGCPIRHLTRFESTKEELGEQAPNENLSPFEGMIHLADPSQSNDDFSRLDHVSKVFIKQKVFQQMVNYTVLFHLVVVIIKHICHIGLRRKGSYFSQSVNDFV